MATELDPSLCAIGAIVARVLELMSQHVRAGLTTGELDQIAERELLRLGARATPRHAVGFPAATCISVNSEAVHGIPSKRVLLEGDVVKLDLCADRDGWVADAARTVSVGEDLSGIGKRLAQCTQNAFLAALAVAMPGNTTRDLGRAIERVVRESGFTVLRELAGHGVGRSLHEWPCIPNYDEPLATDVLVPGMVLAIEPIISAGGERLHSARDGWTLGTADGSLTAHYEETVVITREGPIVITV